MIPQSVSVNNNLVQIKRYFRRGGFAFNIGTLFAGNITAQMIGLIAAPIITRLYFPEHFGQMALVATITETLALIACFRYETAIVLPEQDEKALTIVALCLLLTLLFSFFISIIWVFMGESIARLMNMETISNYFWVVPVGVLLHGVFLSLDYWNTRVKRFYITAIGKALQPLSGSLTKITAGLMVGSTAFWLILGNVLGSLVIAAIFSAFFIKFYMKLFMENLNGRKIWETAKEFKDFPRYNGVVAMINNLSQQLPVFLFAYFYSAEIVAFYSLARIILTRPIALITRSCEKVFLQKASEINTRGANLNDYLKKTILGLSLIGIVPFSILAIGGEWIFSIVFGPQYSQAGNFAQLLVPWLFFLFINPPAKQVILVRQKLLFDLKFNFIFLGARICAIVGGNFLSSDPWVAVFLFSLVGAVGNIYFIYVAFTIARKN